MGKVSNASVNSFEVWVGVFLLLPCEHESSNKNNWQEVKKALQRRLKTEALKSLPAETKITSLEKHYYLNFCVVVMQTLPSTGRAELFSTVHVISLLAAWSRCKILYWGMPINTTQYLLSSSISGRYTTAGCSRSMIHEEEFLAAWFCCTALTQGLSRGAQWHSFGKNWFSL